MESAWEGILSVLSLDNSRQDLEDGNYDSFKALMKMPTEDMKKWEPVTGGTWEDLSSMSRSTALGAGGNEHGARHIWEAFGRGFTSVAKFCFSGF
eukprot:g10933.t1